MIFPSATQEKNPDERLGQQLKSCLDCNSICWEAFIYCLQRGGKYLDTTHIGLLLYCAGLCDKSIDSILRGTNNKNLYAITSEISELCANSCEQFEEDELMELCAQSCKRCAIVLET